MSRSRVGVVGVQDVPPVRVGAIREALGVSKEGLASLKAEGVVVYVSDNPADGVDLVATFRRYADWRGRDVDAAKADIAAARAEAARAHARKQQIVADEKAGLLVPVATREAEAAEITETAIRLVDEMLGELIRRTAPKRKRPVREAWERKRRIAFAAAAKRLGVKA